MKPDEFRILFEMGLNTLRYQNHLLWSKRQILDHQGESLDDDDRKELEALKKIMLRTQNRIGEVLKALVALNRMFYAVSWETPPENVPELSAVHELMNEIFETNWTIPKNRK